MSLSTCLYPDIVRDYPRIRTLLFASTTDTTVMGFSYDHVPNAVDGYVTEMERCSQSSSEMGTRSVRTNPYSTRMRPLSDMSDILTAEDGVLLEAVEFVGYDGTRIGSPDQNADNNAAIEASQTSVLDAYMASHVRAGILGNWQPNYCRPSIYIDDLDVLNMADSSVVDPVSGTSGHLGDMSVGIPLPFVLHYYREFTRVRKVNVFGGLAQWIGSSADPVNRLVRYPLVCIMRWRLH